MENWIKYNNQEIKEESKKVKVSIGLPIYNSQKFIRKRLENILSQTFNDFELVISDNASTDDTVKICKEFMKKDSRIKLYVQNKNIGQFNNYNFILDHVLGEYFMWIADDDLLSPQFLEKNFNVLESNKKVVTSVSKLKMFGEFTNILEKEKNITFFKKIENKIKTRAAYMSCFPVSGEYNDRVNKFFKKCRHSQVFYGLHRTYAIKKCKITKSFLGQDTFYALSLLRYGEIHVIDDKLMQVFDGGDSRSGNMIKIVKMTNSDWYGVIFPWLPMTLNCKKQIGMNLFLKNSSFFIKLNLSGLFSYMITIFRMLRNKIILNN
jgi:glycosyltransferase involved in cell wall biosynthesis